MLCLWCRLSNCVAIQSIHECLHICMHTHILLYIYVCVCKTHVVYITTTTTTTEKNNRALGECLILTFKNGKNLTISSVHFSFIHFTYKGEGSTVVAWLEVLVLTAIRFLVQTSAGGLSVWHVWVSSSTPASNSTKTC